jgi:hypothetical protein
MLISGMVFIGNAWKSSNRIHGLWAEIPKYETGVLYNAL